VAEFAVTAESPLPPRQAWDKLTDWPRHGRHVPFTRMRVSTPPPNGVGTVFVARTALGPLGFDDPMQIVHWQPPGADAGGHCRIEKRGRVMLGWAELSVVPSGQGSRATWREDAAPNHLPRFLHPIAALSARLLFGRVLRRLLAD
jgi:hypothetical protein